MEHEEHAKEHEFLGSFNYKQPISFQFGKGLQKTQKQSLMVVVSVVAMVAKAPELWDCQNSEMQ